MWKLHDLYRIRPEQDGHGLVYDSKTGEIYVVNQVGMHIVSRCSRDPLPSTKEIVHELCQQCNDASGEIIERDTISFLEDLKEKGILVEVCSQDARSGNNKE